MKALLPWLFFVASGAFNVFFVAGMAMSHGGRRGAPGPEDRAAFLARTLDLDEAQRQALVDLEKKADEERERISAARDARFAKLVDELAKDQPNEAGVKEFLDSAGSPDRERHFVNYLRAVMKILRPEQRAKAAEWFRKGPHGRRKTGGAPCGDPAAKPKAP
jgi:Spy/CpxP family protein refolding chaperone